MFFLNKYVIIIRMLYTYGWRYTQVCISCIFRPVYIFWVPLLFTVVSLGSSPPFPLQFSQHLPYKPLSLSFLCFAGIFIGLPKVANGKDRGGSGANETTAKMCGPLLIQNPSMSYLYIFPLLIIQIFDILYYWIKFTVNIFFYCLLGIIVD